MCMCMHVCEYGSDLPCLRSFQLSVLDAAVISSFFSFSLYPLLLSGISQNATNGLQVLLETWMMLFIYIGWAGLLGMCIHIS